MTFNAALLPPALTAALLGLLPAAASASDDTVFHDAHVHGAAVLMLIQEGSEVAIELNSPAMNITGFEHYDGSDKQKAAIAHAIVLMEGADFKRTFDDFRLHVEFQLPYMPASRGQKRGNSGIYLQSRYEVQVLDSFGLDGVFNECGALYRYQPPRINMCLPPLQWQTYDITFRSPRFDRDENKIQNARLTLKHNGVVVHDHFNIERKTGAGKKESPDPYPIRLQNHSDPVRYRNIWIVDHSPRGQVYRTASQTNSAQ